jgi:hypothetical protein
MADPTSPVDPFPPPSHSVQNPQVRDGGFNVSTGTILPPQREVLLNVPPLRPPPVVNPPSAPQMGGAIDDCMKSVTVLGLEYDATVDVFVDGAWRGTGVVGPQKIIPPNLILMGGNNDSLPFGPPSPSLEILLTGCCLKIGQLVQATQTNPSTGLTSGLSKAVRAESHSQYDWLTQHFEMARTGWNPNERKLSPQTDFSKFRQRIQFSTDGKTYAQPLYLHHQFFPGLGARNVVILATENDSVYAYDADALGDIVNGVNQGVLIWHRRLLLDNHRAVKSQEDLGCGDVSPLVGISSTPVIECGCQSDCSCGSSSSGCGCADTCRSPTAYIVAKSISDIDGSFHIRLHAIDVITGLERPNSPVDILATAKGTGGDATNSDLTVRTADGNGNVLFNPKVQNNRPGLLLLKGDVYIGFASHCDKFRYFGWVLAYDSQTLGQKSVFCTTPDGPLDVEKRNPKGGIWQSGMGLASDGSFIYCTTGNGHFNADTGGRDYGDSVLKLSLDLKLVSSFTENDNVELNVADLDFGAGGVLVVPDPQAGPAANILVTGGKTGDIFVLDRNRLGGFSGLDPTGDPTLINNPGAISVIQLQPTQIRKNDDSSPGCWGGPAYFRSQVGQFVFYCGNGSAGNSPNPGPLTSFALSNGVLTPVMTSRDSFPMMGSIPVVSSNGDSSGLVWAVNRVGQGLGTIPIRLRVYDALDVSTGFHPIDGWEIGRWSVGRAFVAPTVINGKVYVACEDHVGVFF